MLSGDYTGECSPDRQCLCVQDYPTDDIKCGGEPDILTDENISVIVILGLSFLWAGPITWFFKRRLYPPLGWERVRGRVRGPCERGYGSTDESTTRDHAGIVLQGGPGGINGRGGADRQGGSVAMPTAIAMPGAATGSVAMPTVIATPGAAVAMPTAIATPGAATGSVAMPTVIATPGAAVAMPTAIATPGAATGSVAMPTVIATPGAAAAMPVAMGIVIS